MMIHNILLTYHLKQISKILLLLVLIFGYCTSSTVFAEIYTIDADGFYIMGDGPIENKTIAQNRARMDAKRAAIEKAGVFIESTSTVKNGQLIKDEINTISSQIIKIKSEKITSESIDGNICYKAHIVAVIDTSSITQQLIKDRQRLYEEIQQYQQKEQELKSIKNELIELKSKYKIANNSEKEIINKQFKKNEARFEAIDYVDKGNHLYSQGQYNQAINLYRRSIELDSSLAIAWNNLGFTYCQTKDYPQSIENLLIASKLDAKNAAIWSNIGYVYAEIGDYQKSINYLRKATMDLNSDWSPAWNNLGTAYGFTGDYQAEIIYCTKATQLDSTNVYAWNNLGTAYNETKDYSKAIKCLKKAIDLDNNFAPAWFNIGYAYGGLSYWADAIKCYKRACELAPQNQKYIYFYNFAKQMSYKNK